MEDERAELARLRDENARLHERQAELLEFAAQMRLDHRQAMALQDLQRQMLELIARGEPLTVVLDALVRLSQAETGMLGSVLLCEDGKLRHGAAPDLPDDYNRAIDGVAIGEGVGSCGTAAFRNEVVIVEDIGTHPFWAPYKELAMGAGLQACWSHPVTLAGGEVAGTFALYYTAPCAPDEHHLQLVELAARLASIAIERDRDRGKLSVYTRSLNDQTAFTDQLLQNLSGGVSFLDRDLVYRIVNHTYAKVFDRKPEDFIGRNILEVFPEAVDLGLEAIFRRVIDTGEPFEAKAYPFTYTDETGTHDTVWDYTLTAQRNHQQDIVGLVALCIDVSERVAAERAVQDANEELTAQAEELIAQAEELNAANEEVHAVNETLIQQTEELMVANQQLHEHQGLLQGVLDSAISGILVGDAVRDEQGRIVDFRFTLANPMTEKIVGFTREELIGHTLLERFPANVEAGLFDLYVRVAETGAPEERETYYTDGRLNYWVGVSAVKVGDGLAITFTDITPRKREEERLRELSQALAQQRRFAETLVDRLPAGVTYIDKDFVFKAVNPTMARFYGKPLDRVLDRPVYEVLPGSEAAIGPLYDQVRETLQPLVVSAVPVSYDVDGVQRLTHWDATIVPYLDAHGEFDGWLVLAEEISGRLKLEAERDAAIGQRIADLEEANVHKEQFLSILSHELRTPINAIMGFASVLDDDVLGPLTPDQHTYLGRILDGSDRMLALINDLLDMSRIQAGKFAISPGSTDLASVCRGVVESLQPLADQNDVTMAFEPGADLPAIVADAQRIEQIVTNLVGNAIKFTPGGGRVTVAVRAEGDSLRVTVRDTGIGISAEHQARIFDAFTQVDMSNTRRSGGAGLGLAISKSLVEAHGGEVGVESTPGEGSAFWFTLPRLA